MNEEVELRGYTAQAGLYQSVSKDGTSKLYGDAKLTVLLHDFDKDPRTVLMKKILGYRCLMSSFFEFLHNYQS